MDPEAFVVEFETEHGPALAEAGVELEISAGDHGSVVIDGLRVPNLRRLGKGTAALALLCGMADRAGVPLLVRPEPIILMVDHPVSDEGLRRFYARMGFAPRPDDAGGLWCRQPAGVAP